MSKKKKPDMNEFSGQNQVPPQMKGSHGGLSRENFYIDENGKKVYKRTSVSGMKGPFGGPGGGPRRRGPGADKSIKDSMSQIDFSVLKKVFGYILKYKFGFIVSIICIMLSAYASVKSSTAFGTLIDNYIAPMVEAGAIDRPALVAYILKLAIIFAVSIITMFINNLIYVVMTQGILRDIRKDMFNHMQNLPIRYFDTNSFGDIMSHYTNDIETLRQLMSQTIPQAISAVITLIAVLFTMLKTSVWLTVFAMIFIFFMSKITTKIAMISGRFFMAQQESLGSLNGFIEEMVDGQKVVKVFNHEQKAVSEFETENDRLFEVSKKANTYSSMMGPIMNNLGNIQYVMTAILGAVLVSVGAGNLTLTGFSTLSIGAVIIFLSLGRKFSMTVNNVAQQMSSIVMATAGAQRIFKLCSEEPEEDEGNVTLVNATENADGCLTECEEITHVWAWKVPQEDGSHKLVKVKGDVRLNHVDFSYIPEKQVLYDVSVYAEPGQKVAFVGSTGAGKTTITNLINRFYDIQSGEITYDGIPIKSIKKADLRNSLGIVLQDVNLFSGTIRENIRYGKLDATDEEVYEAAKLVNAHDFITRLPEGYDTVIDGTGSQLSQGQRQLISIARAAVANPPVMIMDEATSSIDTRTEMLVQRGMDRLMKGRTVFVIAHRLSTVMNSDVIMVLEHGRIIERGSHEQLIEKQGKYYQLYTGAFELD